MPENASEKILVPVSSPAHPSHGAWLEILLKVLEAATAIGPAVVAVTDPKDAALAGNLGAVSGSVLRNLP